MAPSPNPPMLTSKPESSIDLNTPNPPPMTACRHALRAILKRPENFSGPETVLQSSRDNFRVFLKAPEKF